MDMEWTWNDPFHMDSISIPYGFHMDWFIWIPCPFHMDHMSIPYGFHVHSIWTSPYGFHVHSIWIPCPFHMDQSIWIPCPFHLHSICIKQKLNFQHTRIEPRTSEIITSTLAN